MPTGGAGGDGGLFPRQLVDVYFGAAGAAALGLADISDVMIAQACCCLRLWCWG